MQTDQFANDVLTPGFIEGHAHLMAGAMWNYPYVGYHDRIDTEGKLWPGLLNIEDVIRGLKEAEARMTAAGEPAEKPLYAWGFDRSYPRDFTSAATSSVKLAKLYSSKSTSYPEVHPVVPPYPR